MNWTILVIAFCLAVLAGAISMATLARMRPQWSNRRSLLTASAILPAITLLITGATVLLVLVSYSGEGGEMRDLAASSLAKLGAVFALLAFVGGVVGAALRQRGMNR